jgi:hypothetical protein
VSRLSVVITASEDNPRLPPTDTSLKTIERLADPERIPIDLKEELHIRSDRLAVEYRRWLRELGITYGTYGD